MYAKDPYKPKYQFLLIDDIIVDMINNKILNSIVTGLFFRGTKVNISLVFIIQWFSKLSEDVRLNTTHFFITKLPNKRELQGTALNHSSDIDPKKFTNIYRECTKEPYCFNGTTLPPDNPLRIRKNLWN